MAKGGAVSDRLRLRAAPRPRHTRRRTQQNDPLTAAAQLYASAQHQTRPQPPTTRAWQKELWAFYDTLGEYAWSVDWLVKALSRVRLVAAEQIVTDDKPTPLESGPAVEHLARLGGGPGGISELMADATAQLSVPGEGWLVGDVAPGAGETWQVYSTEEIRAVGARIEVQVDENAWMPLDPETSMVTRVWQPDRRLRYRPTSSAKAALPVMRRLDLLDRRIVTTLVSRIAMNGFLLIPQEGTVTTPSQYHDAADPFVAMMMDIGSTNMKTPGSAAAAFPMPIKFPAEFIEKWRHLTIGDTLATELLEERDRELRRLATAVNVPAEVVLGLGQSNHWTAWQLEESAIKMHVVPMAETVCRALTVGFLHPMLLAAGESLTGPNGGLIVVGFDTSELTQRPDKSDQAFRAYDRLEVSGRTLRRESGFDESDKPDRDEIYDQLLKQLARSITLGPWVMQLLTGRDITPPERPSGPAGGPGSDDESEPAAGPDGGPAGDDRDIPDTRGQPPPAPDADLSTVEGLAAVLARIAEHRLPGADYDRPAPAAAPASGAELNGARQ